MTPEAEVVCRIALGLMILGAALIGIPHRLRADPAWFWLLMAVVGPPVTLVCLGFLVNPRWVDFARLELPDEWRLLGAPVGLAGLALFAWMFRHLGPNVTSTSMPRRQATLVTSGPYRWVRHPMYSAALTLAVAAALLTASVVVAAGGLAMFALLAARAPLEERRLVERFGVAYQTYQHGTGRFVPRLRRDRAPGGR